MPSCSKIRRVHFVTVAILLLTHLSTPSCLLHGDIATYCYGPQFYLDPFLILLALGAALPCPVGALPQ